MAAALVCIGACCSSKIAVEKQWKEGRFVCPSTIRAFGGLALSSGRRRKARVNWCCNAAAAAASNSDSRPDLWKSGAGYHPLEELSSVEKEEIEKQHAGKLSDGEIARSIAEVNSNAILLAPALSQSNAVYGTEIMYLVDEHGDIYFELADDNDVLHSLSMDPRCSFIIGFGELNELLTTELLPTYESHLTTEEDSYEEEVDNDVDDEDDIEEEEEEEDEEDEEEGESDEVSSSVLHDVHPMVFASKLAKVAASDVVSNIYKPSMRLAMAGVVRSVTDDEEPYARRVWEDRFLWEDDESSSDEGEDEERNNEAGATASGEAAAAESDSSSETEEEWTEVSEPETSLYKFELHSIQLASDIGAHAAVNPKEFRYSEADVLAHTSPDILKRLNSGGKKMQKALKSLCHREKGVEFEEVVVIGVDSLGMDIRASRGIELRTMRFPFARRARCVDTSQLLIHQLLYPRSRHRKS